MVRPPNGAAPKLLTLIFKARENDNFRDEGKLRYRRIGRHDGGHHDRSNKLRSDGVKILVFVEHLLLLTAGCSRSQQEGSGAGVGQGVGELTVLFLGGMDAERSFRLPLSCGNGKDDLGSLDLHWSFSDFVRGRALVGRTPRDLFVIRGGEKGDLGEDPVDIVLLLHCGRSPARHVGSRGTHMSNT